MEKGSYSNMSNLCTNMYIIFFRLSYCMYILEQLRAMFPNHTLQIMYDIACVLEKHLKVSHAVLYTFVYAMLKYRQISEMTYLITSLLQSLYSMLMDIQLTVRFDTTHVYKLYIYNNYVYNMYMCINDTYIRIKYIDRF